MKSLSNDFLPLQKEQGCPFTAEIPKWTGQPSEARQLIELDKEYYRWKYGTVHPRYKFGLGCEATGIIWVDDRYDGLALSNGGHQPDFSEGNVCTNRLMKAYHAARKAQFDRNRRGLPWMETGQVQYSELPY